MQTNQILTNDDEVWIPRLSSILLAVHTEQGRRIICARGHCGSCPHFFGNIKGITEKAGNLLILCTPLNSWDLPPFLHSSGGSSQNAKQNIRRDGLNNYGCRNCLKILLTNNLAEVKVHIFWEAHKIWRNFQLSFEVPIVTSKLRERFLQIFVAFSENLNCKD